MLDFVDSPGLPEAALWCAVLWRAWDDLQHPNARIRRDAGAFFASPDFDRIAVLAQLDADAIALIRETARQRTGGHDAPVSKFTRKPLHTYQRRSHYLVRHLEYQGEVHPLQEWCRRLRLKPMTVYVRLHRGWTVAEALTGRREAPSDSAAATSSHHAKGLRRALPGCSFPLLSAYAPGDKKASDSEEAGRGRKVSRRSVNVTSGASTTGL